MTRMRRLMPTEQKAKNQKVENQKTENLDSSFQDFEPNQQQPLNLRLQPILSGPQAIPKSAKSKTVESVPTHDEEVSKI